MFRRVAGWFGWPGGWSGADGPWESFRLPDIEALKKELRIERTAREDGEAGYPAGDAAEPSATELDIRARIEKAAAGFGKEYTATAERYREQYDDITSFWKLELIENEENELLGRAQGLITRHSNDLFPESKLLRGVGEELRAFRKRNRLEHRTPTFLRKERVFFVAGVVALVEFGASFILLREAQETLTVAATAVILITFNGILPITVFGPASRWIFDRTGEVMRRAGGWALLAFFGVGFGLALNLLSGHYRDRVAERAAAGLRETDTFEGVREELAGLAGRAVESFVDAPFGLENYLTWIFALLNMVLFFVALWEGMAKNDLYPGYGTVWRKFMDELDRYRDLVDDAQDELEALQREGNAEIGRLKERLKESFHDAPGLIERNREWHARYSAAMDALESHHRTLVSFYRKVNARAREGAPPARFDRPAEAGLAASPLLEISERRPDEERLTRRVHAMADSFKGKIGEAERQIEKVKDIFRGDHLFRARDDAPESPGA